jgi:hypothetical protein
MVMMMGVTSGSTGLFFSFHFHFLLDFSFVNRFVKKPTAEQTHLTLIC